MILICETLSVMFRETETLSSRFKAMKSGKGKWGEVLERGGGGGGDGEKSRKGEVGEVLRNGRWGKSRKWRC